MYNTIEDMLPVLEEWRNDVIEKRVKPSVTGLALALGFGDKSSVYDYAKKPEFSHSVKRALLIVENGYEEALRESNATGSIFALKNMGWVDKQNYDHTTKGNEITQIERVIVRSDETKNTDT